MSAGSICTKSGCAVSEVVCLHNKSFEVKLQSVGKICRVNAGRSPPREPTTVTVIHTQALTEASPSRKPHYLFKNTYLLLITYSAAQIAGSSGLNAACDVPMKGGGHKNYSFPGYNRSISQP